MDFTIITALIGVIATLSGIVLGWSARAKEAKREVRKDAELDTALRTDMEYLKRGVDDIRIEQRSQGQRMDAMGEPPYPGQPPRPAVITLSWEQLFKNLKSKDGEGDEDMLDNLVIYADGDTGAALILSQKLGCPMVHKGSADKYQAAKKHWVGVQGANDSGNVYYAGANRAETARKALK